MTDALKPCPFCGGKAELVKVWENQYAARCPLCVDMPCARPRDKAIAAWNRRASPPDLEGVTDEEIRQAAVAYADRQAAEFDKQDNPWAYEPREEWTQKTALHNINVLEKAVRIFAARGFVVARALPNSSGKSNLARPITDTSNQLIRDALEESQKAVKLLEDLTACRADDEYVSGVQEKIATALSSLPNSPGGVGERERLEDERNVLMNSFGVSPFRDGLTRQRIEEIDRALATAPTAEGEDEGRLVPHHGSGPDDQ